MATTVFLDNFNGSAGPLTGHTPDTSAAPNSWADSSGNAVRIDGSGNAVPSTVLDFNSNAVHTPTAPYDLTPGFTLVVNAYMLQSLGEDSSVMCGAEGVFDVVQYFAGNLMITDIGGGNVGLSALVGSATAFTTVSVAPGAYELKLVVSPSEAKFYVDGTLQQTIVVAPESTEALGIAARIRPSAGGPGSSYGISRVELIASDATPPVTPIFWTNFVKTFEVA